MDFTKGLEQRASSGRNLASVAPNRGNITFLEDRPVTFSGYPPGDGSHAVDQMDLCSQGAPTPLGTDLGDDEPTAAQHRATREMEANDGDSWETMDGVGGEPGEGSDMDSPPTQEPVVQHMHTEPSPQESGTRPRTDTSATDEVDFHRRLLRLEERHRRQENSLAGVHGGVTELSTRMDRAQRKYRRQRKQDRRQRKNEREEDLKQREEDLKQRKKDRKKDLRQRKKEREEDLRQRREAERNHQEQLTQLVGSVKQAVDLATEAVTLATQNNTGGRFDYNYPTSYGSDVPPFMSLPAAGTVQPTPFHTAYNNQRPRNSNGQRKKGRITSGWGAAAAHPPFASTSTSARNTWTEPARYPLPDGVTGPVRTIHCAIKVYSTDTMQTQHASSPEASSSTVSGSTGAGGRLQIEAAGPIYPHPSALHGV
ncbi:hypothetical protein P167DRAFT_550097 [Morchella conica CCBAS932]|uniref:Uncharacterized protein n=1 Tax=Morchella conica CCBAS932 TaxID=1392247 RepID=A0A3N4KF85_9PEZI|nr:hypothetical protein P167DRAFT_550097 [Morchella conica CCBAS932]